jgi:hypothetical protein
MLEDKPLHVPHDMGLDPSVPGEPDRFQPELAFCVGRGDMDVSRFITFIGVKMESE